MITLAALVFLLIIAYRTSQVAQLSGSELIAIVATVLLFIGTVITGGLINTSNPLPAVISQLYQLTPYLTVFATAVTLFFLLGKQGGYADLLK